MKAPNSLMLTTVPVYFLPSSKSDAIISIILIAFCIASASVPHTETAPSSVISILTPVRAMISLIVLPRCPTTSPIFSGLIWICTIFGAYCPTSLRGSAIAGFIQVSMMKSLASLVRRIASSTIGLVSPWILISIWIAVIPSVVPVTLKSMSPKKSSSPWISVRTM